METDRETEAKSNSSFQRNLALVNDWRQCEKLSILAIRGKGYWSGGT